MLKTSRWTRYHPRWPSSSISPRPHMWPWAAPPLAQGPVMMLKGTRAPLPARLKVSCFCKTAIQSQVTDKAFGSTSASTCAGSDARDEPMDMTPTPLDINFRSTYTPHEAVVSTTACLVCASDDHRAGGRRLVSPCPIRSHGRHKRQLRPYP
ncbi:Methionine Synthase [Manis pentadactyla]|nr:Methionine Synthase [Manis pentadactyla]